MATVQASHPVAGDPASVALLLAGPSAAELFTDHTALAGAGATLEVTAPRRAGIGFSAAVSVVSSGATVASGSVSIRPGEGGGSVASTTVTTTRDVNPVSLRHWLQLSLAALDSAALARASAA